MLGLWTLVVLFPLYWVLVTSFKIEVEVDSGPYLLPFVDFTPTLEAWNFMLLQNNTIGPYLNSIVVTLSSTVLALLIGSLAAYALVRIRFQVKLAAIVTFLVLLVAVIVAVAALAVPWQVGRRGRDRALPPGARHVRSALQGGGRQQRHRVLDDLEPDHAADRRRAADLRHVPASPTARHADSR